MIKNKEKVKELVNELFSELMNGINGDFIDKFEVQFNEVNSEDRNGPEYTINIKKKNVLSEKTIDMSNDCYLNVGDKYELIKDDFIFPYGEDGPKLYRIKALKDFGDVKKGDLGGYVEGEHNLSRYGDCWIYDNSCVFDGSFVDDSAKVKEDSLVSSAAVLVGNSIVKGGSRVRSQAHIGDNVVIDNCVSIFHRAYIFGNSVIKDDKDILYFSQDIYPSDQLISYVPESDTWTYPIRGFKPKAFNSYEFKDCIMKHEFDVVDKGYLLNLIELGKKIRYNKFPKDDSSKETTLTKEYVIPEGTYISVGDGVDDRVKIEDLYKQVNESQDRLFPMVGNRDTIKVKNILSISENYTHRPIVLYKLVVLNESTCKIETFEIKSGSITYYDGFKWNKKPIEEVFKEYLSGKFILLEDIPNSNNLRLIYMFKFNEFNRNTYNIHVCDHLRPIFKLDGGTEVAL